jgi:hypothetical protein
VPSTPGNENRASDVPGEEAALSLAQAIHTAGMGAAARVGLEVLKPLHWIAGQFAWALEPFLGAFGPLSRSSKYSIGNLAQLLEREGGVSELSTRLDELSKSQATRTEQAQEKDKR